MSETPFIESGHEQRTRDFLLGKLSEEERLRFEEAWLRDEDSLEELLAVEDELFEEAGRGELEAGDLRALEALPDAGEKFAFAQALAQAADREMGRGEVVNFPASEQRRTSRSWVPWLAAAALAAVVIGWISWPGSGEKSTDFHLAELVLPATGLRTEVEPFVLDAEVRKVAFYAVVAPAFEGELFDGSLQSEDGVEIKRWKGRQAAAVEGLSETYAVRLEVAVDELTSGDYSLTLLSAKAQNTSEVLRFDFALRRPKVPSPR